METSLLFHQIDDEGIELGIKPCNMISEIIEFKLLVNRLNM
jgi:hypothetical protein